MLGSAFLFCPGKTGAQNCCWFLGITTPEWHFTNTLKVGRVIVDNRNAGVAASKVVLPLIRRTLKRPMCHTCLHETGNKYQPSPNQILDIEIWNYAFCLFYIWRLAYKSGVTFYIIVQTQTKIYLVCHSTSSRCSIIMMILHPAVMLMIRWFWKA